MRRQFKANTKKPGSVPDCVWKRRNRNRRRIDAGRKMKKTERILPDRKYGIRLMTESELIDDSSK